MSSIYSFTDFNGSLSIHSDPTEDLPRLCDDSDCLYPFGPACDACSFALDIKEHPRRRSCQPDRTSEWVQEVKINRHIVLHAGEAFTGGADETNGPIVETKQEGLCDEVKDDNLSELEYDGDETDVDFDFVDARSDSTLSTLCLPSPGLLDSSSSAYSWIVNSSTVSHGYLPDPRRLSPWLDNIFDHTLHGQVNNTHFAGGADVEQNPNVDNCPLCSKPIGDPTDQHWLKCKYAHEERERFSKWGSTWFST